MRLSGVFRHETISFCLGYILLLLEMQDAFIFNYFVVLCNAIKNNTSLMTVNFSGCSLTWRGADTLARVIRVSCTLIMTAFAYKIDTKTLVLNQPGC